jgi:ketosteroid isomerase-like protein
VVDATARLPPIDDEREITRLKASYARACDDGYDADRIAGLFTPDGVWDGGELFGRAEGANAIRAHFAGAAQRIPWSLHFTLNPLIDVAPDGETATGSWYLWQPCIRQRSSAGVLSWLAGTYADTYVRTKDGWRFRAVTVVARWLDGPPAGLPGQGGEQPR